MRPLGLLTGRGQAGGAEPAGASTESEPHSVRGRLAGEDVVTQAAFVERDARNHADIEFFADWKELIIRRLVKYVVDDLDGINEPGADSGNAIGRLPAIEADAEGANAAAGF